MTATTEHLNARHKLLIEDADTLDKVIHEISVMEQEEPRAKELLSRLAAARDFRAVLERTVAREQSALDRERDLARWTPPTLAGESDIQRAARAASTTTQAFTPIEQGPNGTVVAPHPELLGEANGRTQDVRAQAMRDAIEPPSTNSPSGAHPAVRTGTQPKGRGGRD